MGKVFVDSVLSWTCVQDLLGILDSVPSGNKITLHSNLHTTKLIHWCTRTPIMYTRSIHDSYTIVYTEVMDPTCALRVYTEYHSRLLPGGKLIYYIKDRPQVIHVLHTIFSDEFELTYYPFFIVFTKLSEFSLLA